MPPSDQIVSSLLATELNDSAAVVPVDFSNDIVSRLVTVLGDAEKVIPNYTDRGEAAIPDWVKLRAAT